MTSIRDGNDGPWSTFDIHVGTPPQPIRVLISTSFAQTVVVLNNSTEGGCIQGDPPNCADSRGGLMDVNSSTTWHGLGNYSLGLDDNLHDYVANYDTNSHNGNFGFDAVGFGSPGTAGLTLDSQLIAAIATNDLYLGFLGLNKGPSPWVDTLPESYISSLSSLKQSNNTPSLSYGYSAGARYRKLSTSRLYLDEFRNLTW